MVEAFVSVIFTCGILAEEKLGLSVSPTGNPWCSRLYVKSVFLLCFPVVQEMKKETALCIQKCHQQQLTCRLQECLARLPFSPNFAHGSFHFCRSLQKHFKGKSFWHNDEMKAKVHWWMQTLRSYFFLAGIKYIRGVSESSRTRSEKKYWFHLLNFGCHLLQNTCSLLGNVYRDPIVFSTLQKYRGSYFP
jgi:hypothetical protein